MNYLHVFYIILPLLIAFVLSSYKEELLILTKRHILSVLDHKDLVVTVLSARGNFEQRQTIRDTWWGFVQNNSELSKKIDLKFVVGDSACKIPPEDRDDPYACDKWHVSHPGKDEILAVVEEPKVDIDSEVVMTPAIPQLNYPIQTINFRVQYPVILSKLGVHEDSLQGRAAVKLYDAATNGEIVSTVFSKESPGVLVGGFRYKAVEPYLLPQGFEGTVTSENLIGSSVELPVSTRPITMRITDGGGIIKFQPTDLDPVVDGHYTDPRSFGSGHLIVSSFIYTVHEAERLAVFLENGTVREAEWESVLRTEEAALVQEVAHYSDLRFVPVTDTYRNIPRKLLKFYQWLSQEVTFDFVLKTDDDCFVDLERILDSLDKVRGHNKIWWSRFRNNWAVEHHGKWAEPDFRTMVYPRFACGSGNVLSRDLIDWIAQNAESLKIYQGEDISMGIWLSAVGPIFIDDPKWQCEKECISNMYTMPELAPDEIKQIWTDRETCDDPCGCS